MMAQSLQIVQKQKQNCIETLNLSYFSITGTLRTQSNECTMTQLAHGVSPCAIFLQLTVFQNL